MQTAFWTGDVNNGMITVIGGLLKTIFIGIAAFYFLLPSLVSACVNISGEYAITENTVLRIEQKDCEALTKVMGIVSSDGTVQYLNAQTLPLDGSFLCNRQNLCESAKPILNAIELTRNYDGTVGTEAHGRCLQRSNSLSRDGSGNLTSTFQVSKCQDGYAGSATKVFPKL